MNKEMMMIKDLIEALENILNHYDSVDDPVLDRAEQLVYEAKLWVRDVEINGRR